jgi:hypothetical protein
MNLMRADGTSAVKEWLIRRLDASDRYGDIADAHVGMVGKDEWEQEIQQLLNEPRR